MVKKNGFKALGAWAFFLGVLIAVIMTFIETFTGASYAGMATILAFIGVIIGVLNITRKEYITFLMAALILSIGGMVSAFPFLQGFVATLLQYVAYVAFPAGVVVGFKALWVTSGTN